ncbi:MAG: SusD/RagB family nutrient-binding outer membrane lipoprotein [Proteiniphilum sp.]|uniref:SusD/RagB family nutrient-binding outer membrane lipoprotein n=1 Tax=Proteiniphilum sp. TaxID=1926877 RepID=UPI00092888FC|nr:SusD/RagB family nutrient-binding outer membrane lipoprotein [Proteiniphilum sp.]MEA5129087.1 SusD/RagB family nutrient-binding outer membrane lipoprotein [Proteiniphilum sp.]OJV86101.1 MAG: hypothetical protein BGO34_19600 [Bacteroidia bacterium 44-10]
MKNIVKLFLALSIVIYLGGCTDDYLDVNKDPNRPTAPELNQLLSGSEYYMVQALSQGDFIGQGLASYVHYLNPREDSNYGMGPGANNPYNSWNYLYTYVLNDYEAIIEYAEPDENLIYVGIAKTLKAYAFSVMVDIWGDIPYSEFNNEEITAPKPDSSKDIYNALIALLEEGRADFQNTGAANGIKPGKDDFFYGGDVDKWIRLNNTIKLRLLLHSRKAKSDITDWQGKFNALITENAFITTDEEGNPEDFQFWYNNVTSPAYERHPAYSSYTGQHTHYISPFFYETMMGQTYNTTDNPFAGIKDPRVPYYFYNPMKSNEEPPNGYEYRNGNFLSIFFATMGPNAGQDNRHMFTKYSIYPIGGKYDDGNGGRVEVGGDVGTLGTGIAPHKMITYAALKFMLAELVLTGEMTGDARAYLSDGISAAIDHVHSVIDKNGSANPAPKISDDDREKYIDAVLAKYDAANAEGKMRIVMTQKWIHNFMNPIDAYTDYRRTGYPVLFDPNKTQDPGYGVNPSGDTEKSDARVELSTMASYPRSLYYPTNSETELNVNMPQKNNVSVPLVFWDK